VSEKVLLVEFFKSEGHGDEEAERFAEKVWDEVCTKVSVQVLDKHALVGIQLDGEIETLPPVSVLCCVLEGIHHTEYVECSDTQKRRAVYVDDPSRPMQDFDEYMGFAPDTGNDTCW